MFAFRIQHSKADIETICFQKYSRKIRTLRKQKNYYKISTVRLQKYIVKNTKNWWE